MLFTWTLKVHTLYSFLEVMSSLPEAAPWLHHTNREDKKKHDVWQDDTHSTRAGCSLDGASDDPDQGGGRSAEASDR